MKNYVVAVILIAALASSFVPVCLANEPPADWLQWTSPDGEWTVSYPDGWRPSKESETSVTLAKLSNPIIIVAVGKAQYGAFPLNSLGIEVLESHMQSQIADQQLDASVVDSGYWTDGVQGIFVKTEIERESGTLYQTSIVYHPRNVDDQA